MFGSYLKNNALFVDVNLDFGAKIRVSGGGKCNITNQSISPCNYLGESEFIAKTLKCHTSADTLNFFAKFGVIPTIKKDGRYFCKSSIDVLNVFRATTAHHKFLFAKKAKNVFYKNGVFITEFEDMQISSKKIIVASGGASYPNLNTSDIGCKIAQSFGLDVKTLTPALVGLSIQKEQFWFKKLSGVSLRAKIKCGDFTYENDLLFSHRGISGPAVLNASLRWEKGNIAIDFLPSFEFKDSIWSEKRQPSSILPLPKSFIKAFLASLEFVDKPMKNYTQEEKNSIIKLKNYEFAPAGTFGYSKAEVTRGGIKTDEIKPLTFESKKQQGLYFIGEVLDVTGELGGYNLQWAFSSGACAAKHFKI